MKLTLVLLLILSIIPLSQPTGAKSKGEQTAPSAPITRLVMHSESGDYIGAGQEYLYTDADGTFTPWVADWNNDGLIDYAEFSFFGSVNDFWGLSFGTHRFGTNIAVGVYNRAERAPFASDGHPGLDVFGNGRGCNESTGKFVVLDAKFDYSVSPVRVVSFAAQFEQHCEGSSRALFGYFYYNYAPTVTLSVDRTTATAGQPVLGTVTLANPAPQGGATVNLASNNAALASVPATIVVPEGQTAATFPVTTNPINARPKVTLTAAYQGVASGVTMNVRSPFASLTQLNIHVDATEFSEEFNRTYNESDGTFELRADNFDGGDDARFLSVFFNANQGGFYILHFSTQKLGVPLAPGHYPNAQRAPFEQPGHPGLDVSGNVGGCNQITGEFTVFDATFDETFSPPQIVSFAAEFKLLCEGRPPVISGSIYFNFVEEVAPSPFDICLQAGETGEVLRIDSETGQYQFTNCDGLTVDGTGTLRVKGCTISLKDSTPDRRIQAMINTCNNIGTASVQIFSPRRTYNITDLDTTDSCGCN